MIKLEVWVHPQFRYHSAVVALEAKGHIIHTFEGNADLILHPNAWRWDDTKWPFIEVAIKEARRGQPKRTAAPKPRPNARSRKGPKESAG